MAAVASTPLPRQPLPKVSDVPAITPATPARSTDTSTSTTTRNSRPVMIRHQPRSHHGTRSASRQTPHTPNSTATLKPLIARKWLSPVAEKVCRNAAYPGSCRPVVMATTSVATGLACGSPSESSRFRSANDCNHDRTCMGHGAAITRAGWDSSCRRPTQPRCQAPMRGSRSPGLAAVVAGISHPMPSTTSPACRSDVSPGITTLTRPVAGTTLVPSCRCTSVASACSRGSSADA